MTPRRDLDSELRVARRVMDDLLPHQIPALEGLDVAARREASHEVGGDYYEFISLGDDRWGIAIADVVGKGIAAALLVAAMRASLASLASQELALRANSGVCRILHSEDSMSRASWRPCSSIASKSSSTIASRIFWE